MLKFSVLALVVVLAAAGCEPKEVSSAGFSAGEKNPTAAPLENKPAPPEPETKEYSVPYPDRKPKDGEEVGVFETDKGRIVFMFFPDKAPKHVAQIKKLIGMGFYNGTRFHRCIKDFMIQGGDPASKDLAKSATWGMNGYTQGGKEVNIPAEFTDIQHKRGVMSAARSGNDVNSASSQFFIMHADYPSLDGQYSAWGQVLSGMDAVDQIVLTGNPADNGSVVPAEAIVLKSAKLAKWPVQ